MGEAINLVNNFKIEKVILNCGEINELEQELIKVLQEQERDNWIREQLKLCEQYPSTYEIIKSISELEPKPLDIDTQISNIKRQLKYEKNPLIIKNLNRKMNKLIKEKKNV